MKKIVAVSFFVLSFSVLTFAQSGRRIAPTPTPTPSVQSNLPNYSESKPVRTRAVIPFPSIRNRSDSANQSKDQTENAEVLSDSEDEVIKVETSFITIPVSVFDRNGLYIPNLTQDDFKIFEDGKEQEIAFFDTSEKPFTVVLLLDTSPSTEYKIEEIQNAAIAFVDKLKPQDSVMVIEFDGNVHVLTEATNDRQRIYKAIQRADFGGGTSLYDAVDFSIRKRLSKIEGRKAIVLFTDGVDTTSTKANYDSTLREAEEFDAIVFPIYYNTFFDNRRGNGGVMSSPFPFPQSGGVYGRGTSSQDYVLGRQYLNDLSAVTGGRVFNADKTEGGLNAAFEGIAEELRRQYNIGYYPLDTGKTGQRKQIKVRVDRPNLIVRARDSYIVGATPAKTPTTDTPKSK